MSEDYCDLCDLPLSTCVHGMPPAPKAEPPAPAVRTTRAKPAGGAPRPARAPRAAKPSKAEAPVRRAARRFTPPDEFVPHILAVLQEAGGELDNDAFYDALEESAADLLIEGDRSRTPEGELRWRRAARVARRGLVGEGLMATGSPGLWVLTPAGVAHRIGS